MQRGQCPTPLVVLLQVHSTAEPYPVFRDAANAQRQPAGTDRAGRHQLQIPLGRTGGREILNLPLLSPGEPPSPAIARGFFCDKPARLATVPSPVTAVTTVLAFMEFLYLEPQSPIVFICGLPVLLCESGPEKFGLLATHHRSEVPS
jgi:hypothetical protein